MIIKPGFVVKRVGDQEIVIAIGKAADDFEGYITLNGSAKLLWNALTKGATKDELVSLLLATYDVEEDIATDDVERFIEKLESADIIKEEESDLEDEEDDD